VSKIMQVVGFANGEPCPIVGQYLLRFNFDTEDGRGFGLFTERPDQALKFASASKALEFWETQSQTVPLRPDGSPNRPLTCTAFEIVECPP
jgi:hypothetical protein